jgi:hypothetical protein
VKASATNHMVDTLQETGRVEWAVSVASRADASVYEIAMEAGEKVWKFNERPQMRVTTVGTLRASGYDVVPDELPHALVMLPNPPADTDYEAVSVAFGNPATPPIPNPSYKGAT